MNNKKNYNRAYKIGKIVTIPTVALFICTMSVLHYYADGIDGIYACTTIATINIAFFCLFYLYVFPTLLKKDASMVTYILISFVFFVISSLGQYYIQAYVLSLPQYVINMKLPPTEPLSFFIIISLCDHSAAWCFFLVLNTHSLSEESYHLLVKGYKIKINSLRVQMNPHFLSNVLNNLSTILDRHEKEKAISYNNEIIELLGEQLKFMNAESISIQEEFSWLEYYIHVEQQRLSNSFDYQISVDNENLYFSHIPPMLIQPIVENSIIHGFNPEIFKGKGLISISAHKVNRHTINIVIKDNGVGNNALKNLNKKRKSISTFNIHQRIRLINEIGRYNISIKNEIDEGGTSYKLIIKENNLL